MSAIFLGLPFSSFRKHDVHFHDNKILTIPSFFSHICFILSYIFHKFGLSSSLLSYYFHRLWIFFRRDHIPVTALLYQEPVTPITLPSTKIQTTQAYQYPMTSVFSIPLLHRHLRIPNIFLFDELYTYFLSSTTFLHELVYILSAFIHSRIRLTPIITSLVLFVGLFSSLSLVIP